MFTQYYVVIIPSLNLMILLYEETLTEGNDQAIETDYLLYLA